MIILGATKYIATKINGILLCLITISLANSADVMTVDPTGVTTITGTAPAAAPATGEVKIGGGQIRAQGAVTAGDVVVNRTTQATGGQVVRGDDQRLIPTAMIMPFAGSVAPGGWLMCDGSAISRTTYPALFATIGTTFGAGNGVDTFNLPDLRGRTLFGAGLGVGLTNRTLGGTGGEENHTLTIAEMPSHSHALSSGVSGIQPVSTWNHAGGNGDSEIVTQTNATGGGAPHNTMPPFLVVNYFIKQ